MALNCVQVRDYLADDRAAEVRQAARRAGAPAGDEPAPLYQACQMARCWISAAPRDTPFHMTEEHSRELGTALQQQAASVGASEEQARALRDALCEHVRRDHAFDVLIWLHDAKGHSHFLVAQCKARADFEAHVDAKPYAAHAGDLQLKARPLGCLAPLLWCSNVTSYRAFAAGGDLNSTAASGRALQWLLPHMCSDDKGEDLFRRAAEAAEASVSGAAPERALPRAIQLRAHQVEAAAALSAARARGVVRGTVNHFTGSGKVSRQWFEFELLPMRSGSHLFSWQTI